MAEERHSSPHLAAVSQTGTPRVIYYLFEGECSWYSYFFDCQLPASVLMSRAAAVSAAEVTSRVSSADNRAATVAPQRAQLTAGAPQPLAEQFLQSF